MGARKLKQPGFSLIELMVGMLIGLVVLGGVVAIFTATIRSSTDTVNSTRMNHDLNSVMQLMVNDIRRAGYWGGAIAGSNANNRDPNCATAGILGNPFTCGNANIQISNKTGEDVNTCILYTYDADRSGSITLGNETDDLDLDEYYGFRLNGNGIDIRYSVASAGSTTCDDGNWETIINTEIIEITTLTFSNANDKCLNVTQGALCGDVTTVAGDKVVQTRQIDIILEGEVKDDDTATKSLNGIVKVRNDHIFTAS